MMETYPECHGSMREGHPIWQRGQASWRKWYVSWVFKYEQESTNGRKWEEHSGKDNSVSKGSEAWTGWAHWEMTWEFIGKKVGRQAGKELRLMVGEGPGSVCQTNQCVRLYHISYQGGPRAFLRTWPIYWFQIRVGNTDFCLPTFRLSGSRESLLMCKSNVIAWMNEWEELFRDK